MAKTVYKFPGYPIMRRETTKPTRYIQDKKTGRMTGRKVVAKGKGDGTKINRVKQDFILVKRSKDKRGHVRTIRKKYEDGQILGRK